MKKVKILTLLSVGLLFLDRLTKWLAFNESGSLNFVKNFNFYFFSVNQCLLATIIGAVIILLLLLFIKTENTALLLIIFGGISNLFDRMYFGYVIDWINISISTFNIADIMIVLGIVCLIFRFKKFK